MSDPVILISLLLLASVYWFKSQHIREIALNATKAHCRAMEVQMLDDYVALKSLRLKKDKSGKTRLQTTFTFEFSSTGNERYQGRIAMLGHRVESIYLQPYRIDLN